MPGDREGGPRGMKEMLLRLDEETLRHKERCSAPCIKFFRGRLLYGYCFVIPAFVA